MHNLYAIFAKFRDICKQFAGNLINEEYTSMWCRSQIFRLGSGCSQYGFWIHWYWQRIPFIR